MKIYIAGSIKNNPNYKLQFSKAEKTLKLKGHLVMNPAILPEGFEYEDYMSICFEMIKKCDAVCFITGASKSEGSIREFCFALENKKKIYNYENGIL